MIVRAEIPVLVSSRLLHLSKFELKVGRISFWGVLTNSIPLSRPTHLTDTGIVYGIYLTYVDGADRTGRRRAFTLLTTHSMTG
jgi:hypothetical protein